MQATVLTGDAFDRRDCLALGLLGKHQAREYATATDMHGAGAALTMVAALLCPEQGKPLTQCVEQRCAWIEQQPMKLAVDLQSHAHALWSGRWLGCPHFRGTCRCGQQAQADAGNQFSSGKLWRFGHGAFPGAVRLLRHSACISRSMLSGAANRVRKMDFEYSSAHT